MPKFLILQSPNKGNVGTITQREEGFYKPTFYQISDSELEQYNLMNAHAKAAYIAEKLEAQMGTPLQDKKKVAPIVEIAESQVEHVSAETPETIDMPEVEFEPLPTFDETEKTNEPVNKVEETQEVLNEVAQDLSEITGEIIEVKAKGRPKKVK